MLGKLRMILMYGINTRRWVVGWGMVLIASLSTLVGWAQSTKPCGTADMVEKALAQHPELRENLRLSNQAAQAAQARFDAQRSAASASPGGPVRVIPIVFHIIHNYGSENISDAQVLDAVRILNEDFALQGRDTGRITSPFKPIAGTTNIEFRLARRDPSGNCTNGITRTASLLTYTADENVKDLVNWDTRRYMNVWVVASISFGAGGYSYYPGTAPSQDAEGIVVLDRQCGSIGTAAPFGNSGARTMTHEMGHFLNLPHTWGSSNTPGDPSNCTIDDDVADTPNTVGTTGGGCPLNFFSCGFLSNVENYMDYSSCGRMFTIGQGVRMRTAAESNIGARAGLWQQANLVSTGVNNTAYALCAPQISFDIVDSRICAGNTITLRPSVLNAPVDTSLTIIWRFPGGQPATSTVLRPAVTYPTAGQYPIEFIAYNQGGRDSVRLDDAVFVEPSQSTYRVGQVEDFEGASFPQVGTNAFSQWELEGGADGWAVSTAAAYSGNRSLRIFAAAHDPTVPVSAISPPYDFSTASPNTYLLYKYAGARNSSFDTDKLKFYTSTNCGRSFALRILRQAATGAFSPYTTQVPATSSYIPQRADWRTERIPLQALVGQPSVRFRFELTSGGGNNLYIDSLVVVDPGLPTAVGAINAVTKFSLTPNPATTTVLISLPVKGAFTYYLQDILGRTLRMGEDIQIPLTGLAKGTYLLQVVQGGSIWRQRLVVE